VEFALGFIIALAIALTGVGAGSMTTPLLILLLHVNSAVAVGTALTFGWIVKVASVPMYAFRRQISLRVLVLLLVGGLPGVVAGGFLLNKMKNGPYQGVLYAILGMLIAATALFHLYRQFRPEPPPSNSRRERWLPRRGRAGIVVVTELHAFVHAGSCWHRSVFWAGSFVRRQHDSSEPWKL
jgi:uncharacterized protein